VLLHAVDGLDATWGPLYRDLAAEYAGRGYVVVLVHYFDSTDPDKKDRAGYRDLFVKHFTRREPARKDVGRMKTPFAAWSETACHAVAYARSRPEWTANGSAWSASRRAPRWRWRPRRSMT
jgi:dienelactone hydrolase